MAVVYSGDHPADNLELEFERLLSSSPTNTRKSIATRKQQTLLCPAEPQRPNIVLLDVAGRTFKVSTDTLIAESGLFRRQFSACFNWTPQRDGTYFLDRDPDLFVHI